MSKEPISPLVDLLKALAHPARLRILALLREGQLCVCQITAILGIPTSTASEHLTELRRAGLLAERKDGRWVYYALQPDAQLEGLLEALWPLLHSVGQVTMDHAAAIAIRVAPVADTCNRVKACRRPMSAATGVLHAH